MKKDAFLFSKYTKQAFLLMLGTQLTNAGIGVRHANGDADVSIVSTALEIAERMYVTVVGEDKDLLILLLYNYQIGIHSPVNSNASIIGWKIRKAREQLGIDMTQSMLAINAVRGCDTTS